MLVEACEKGAIGKLQRERDRERKKEGKGLEMVEFVMDKKVDELKKIWSNKRQLAFHDCPVRPRDLEIAHGGHQVGRAPWSSP